MIPTTPDLTKGQIVFGREPAVWIGLLQSVFAAAIVFGLPLTVLQASVTLAFVNAALGLYLAVKVRPVTVAALVAVVQTALPLLVAFGLNVTSEQQGVILTLTGVLLTTFLVRPQVTPAKFPASTVVDAESDVVSEVPYDDKV